MSKIIDEVGHRELLKKLEELGLSTKESLVYLALLPRHDTGTSNLIRATGLHGQFVYDALAKLEELGLAKHVIQNGRKKFSANTPNRLLSLLEGKRLIAESVAKELQDRFAGRQEQNIEVFQGEAAFVAHQMDLYRRMKPGGRVDVIATQTERYMDTFDLLGLSEECERLCVEKNIHFRYLGSEVQRSRLQQREAEKVPLSRWVYRIFPGLATGLMNTDIHPDSISINIFGDPITSVTITSKEVADGYREFFEALWKVSSK